MSVAAKIRLCAAAMAALTTVYLFGAELPFSAELLDVAGSGALAGADVEQIERRGRLISGMALALAAWGFAMPWLARNGASRAKWAAVLAVSAAACCSIAWVGERALIDHIVDASTPSERKVALHSAAAAKGFRDGGEAVEGLAIPRSALPTPEGKAWLAVMPALSLGMPWESVRKAARAEIGKLAGADPAAAEREWMKMADAANGAVDAAFGRYREAARKLAEADAKAGVAELEDASRDAWQQFVKAAGDMGLSPFTAPAPMHARLRAAAAAGGVPVPENWLPSDAAGFRRAFMEAAKTRMQARVREQWAAAFSGLEPGLDREGFVERSGIKAKILEKLKLTAWPMPGGGAKLAEEKADGIMAALGGGCPDGRPDCAETPLGEFRDGGKLADAGRRAAEAVWASPLALAFSALGALVHAVKLAMWVAKMLGLGLGAVAGRVGLAMALAVSAAVAITPSRLAGSPGLAALGGQIGPVPAFAVSALMRAENLAWPAGERIRTALGGRPK